MSLQQGGRNLSCTFAILAQPLSVTSCLDLVPSWSLGSYFGSSPHWSHCIHHLCISRSFSIGCIYTLIFLLYVLLSSINPQSNSNCQETHSDVVPGVCENMGMKTAMCLERALKETESTASSMPSHESSEQPGGCVHHGLHTPSRALRVGAAAAEEAREALDTI